MFNSEAKTLEQQRLVISTEFHLDLKLELERIDAHNKHRNTGGHVTEKLIKAEYQADCIMAHH